MPRRPWAHRGPSQRLASLPMHGVEAAVRAELLQLHPVRVVAPVLAGDVVAVLALLAGHGDLRADVGGSHDGVPFSSVVVLASVRLVTSLRAWQRASRTRQTPRNHRDPT